MKLRMLFFAAISFSLTGASRAADYSDLVAQGYRWVTVDGPYACPTEQDVQRITDHRTDAIETANGRQSTGVLSCSWNYCSVGPG
jgi:hypothetical protein